MTKISVYDLKGHETEKIELPENIFNVKINTKLIAQAVRVYQANKRQGTVSTKTRGEVEGSTRKIYRQKGTGKARHGSIRAPIFVKGGIAFGPKPRDFSLDLPKKMKKTALYSSLSAKLKENAIFVIDGLEKIKEKTKEMVKILKNLKFNPDEEKILLCLPEFKENIIRCFRNLDQSKITNINMLNSYDVLNSNKILFTKEAILKMSQTNNSVEEEKVKAKSKIKKVKNQKNEK